MRLHIVSTGCPDPNGNRYGSCAVLEVAGQLLMFDCGPASTYKLARMGIRPSAVERLFFTHHHFDHNSDYPCFLLSRWDQDPGTAPPLRVYGPPPTESFTERLIGERGAFVEDWKSRVGHPVSELMHTNRGGTLPRPAPRFEVRDIRPGVIEEQADWRVMAVSVHHVEPWLESVAYRVKSSEGTVAFTGDAGPCPALGEVAREADVLVVCCAYAGKAQPLLADVVTGAGTAGQLAAECGVKTVVLTHTTPGLATPGRREAAVVEVARKFKGRIIFADEMTTLSVP